MRELVTFLCNLGIGWWLDGILCLSRVGVCRTSYRKLHLANIKLLNHLFLWTLRNRIIGNPNKKVFTVTLHIIRIKPFSLYGQ